jgi:tripartite ATP-independent transporter DctP family solute receptor
LEKDNLKKRSWKEMNLKRLAMGLALLMVFSTGAMAAEFVLKAASLNSDNFPPQKAFNDFKVYVEKESKGRIEVKKYSDGQLGNINEAMEAVQMGVVQMSFPVITDLAAFDKRLLVVDLPFLFPDFKTAFRALHGDLGKKLEPVIEGLGFKPCGYMSNGTRSISNNRNPIFTPDDLKGLKLRTMQNPMHIAVFKALGANPTPLSYSELYTALQQGVVEGQENSALIMVDVKLHQVQKYYSLTRHIVSVICPVMSMKWYSSLPGDLKVVVDKGLQIYEKNWTEYFDKAEGQALKEMGKTLKINDLTPAQRKLFQTKAQPVYKEFEGTIGKDLIDLAIKSVAKYSK